MPTPILIVDDAQINRKLTQRMLAGAGYDVRTAMDAEAALMLIPEVRPRLILTDVRLPGMDGFAFARRVKKDPETSRTLVIALTGCDTKEDRRKAADAGCDDYIVKPIDTRTFPGVIDAHLVKQARETEAAPTTPAAAPGLPEPLMRVLAGKRIALSGFTGAHLTDLSAMLERACVENASDLSRCDLVIAAVDSDISLSTPRLLVATTGERLSLDLLMHPAVVDFAASPWTVEDLLVRACRAISNGCSNAKAPRPSPRDRKPAVLFADNDQATLTLLKTTVQNSGFDCVTADSGDEALRMMRAAPPDIAVLDVIMPNMDGFEVLAAIRADQQLKDVRVMLLTALRQEADIVRGFWLGADDYVTKPFSPVEVAARLKRLARASA